MSSFVSSFIATADPNPSASSGSPADSDTLNNDGWFPDISLTDLRDAMRIDGTVPPGKLTLATLDAMASVNAELRTWKAAQRAAGCADMEAVQSERLGGKSTHVLRYQRAVYNLVRADVTEQYRGYDSTKTGGQKAEELEQTICESRRNVRWAINDILGIRRSTVELI